MVGGRDPEDVFRSLTESVFLVDELAAEFGVDHHAVGKTVWLAFKKPATP
ncbi:hypothetical protein [Streptomyces sp. NPDC053720]